MRTFPWLALCASCGTPDASSGLSPFTATSPPGTTSVPSTTTLTWPQLGPDLPVGPTLAVDLIVASGPASTITVGGLSSGAVTTLWSGGFGGWTCPTDLGGACIPITAAVPVTTGAADATGAFVVPWTAPTGAEDTYVVFVATADASSRSLPVMRRVWATPPNWHDEEPIDPFDGPDARPFFSSYDDPVVLPPGDWMDLGLEGGADFVLVFAWGNQTVDATTLFHTGYADVLEWFREPPARAAALQENETFNADAFTHLNEGRSLASGEWLLSLEADYGEHQGVYDLSIRVTDPTEPRTWFEDADLDLWGTADQPRVGLVATDDSVWQEGDCDDADDAVNPDVWDVCDDGVDKDCTGTDKPCHAAPTGEGFVEAFVGLQAEFYGNPHDVAAVGDADGDGADEVWIRDWSSTWVLEQAPGAQLYLDPVPNTAGWGHTTSGDFDHDGDADVAFVGREIAPEGAVWFASPPVTPATISTAAWATVVGPSGDLGIEIADSSGDVDGDGFPDTLVGGASNGAAYLLTSVPAGQSAIVDIDTATFESTVFGEALDVFSLGADVDADGVNEIVFAMKHQAYLVAGPFSGALDVPADVATTFDFPDDIYSRVAVGDSDGDGLDELLFAAPFEPSAAWMFESPPPGDADETDAVVVLSATSGALDDPEIGDLDGDGFDDIAIANPLERQPEGAVMVVYGPPPPIIDLPNDADLLMRPMEGETTAHGLWFVDVDADGGEDLVIDSGMWSIDVLYGLP